MRIDMGRGVVLAALAALMSVGCASSSELYAPALEGAWDSPIGGEREAFVFEGVGDAGEIDGLPSGYEHYRAVDGELVLVQSGRYHIETRELTLIDLHEVSVLVRTVMWDADGLPAGTRLEQAVMQFDGDQFQLTQVGLSGSGRTFRAVDSL